MAFFSVKSDSLSMSLPFQAESTVSQSTSCSDIVCVHCEGFLQRACCAERCAGLIHFLALDTRSPSCHVHRGYAFTGRDDSSFSESSVRC